MAKKAVNKKAPVKTGKCIDCKNAYLMRSAEYNPIVSMCKITGDREVARSFTCNIGRFIQIEESDRTINEMIPV